jgi:hypothetical protein
VENKLSQRLHAHVNETEIFHIDLINIMQLLKHYYNLQLPWKGIKVKGHCPQGEKNEYTTSYACTSLDYILNKVPKVYHPHLH